MTKRLDFCFCMNTRAVQYVCIFSTMKIWTGILGHTVHKVRIVSLVRHMVVILYDQEVLYVKEVVAHLI